MQYQPNVQALLELSGYGNAEYAKEMMGIVEAASDPETAIQHVLDVIGAQNDLLQHKWRKHIAQAWFAAHPDVPKNLCIPIQSKDIAYATVLLEAYTLLDALQEGNVQVDGIPSERYIREGDENRIAMAHSVFQGDALLVRRTAALLEELRLVRVFRGALVPVQSRVFQFKALPLIGQHYLLWHVDMYHLDWKKYAHEWQAHLAVFQQYLPMVWEMLCHIYGQRSEIHTPEAVRRIAQAFAPLWQQEAGVRVYDQPIFERMVERWLSEIVWSRYALMETTPTGTWSWNRAGQILLHAECNTKLPCSLDIV